MGLSTALSFLAAPALAQNTLVQDTGDAIDDIGETKFGFQQGSFIGVPIPLSNPTIGSGLILAGGYLFQLDEKSDTSYFGLGAMRTDNESEAVGASAYLSFGEGRWGLSLLYGQASLKYDLYPFGGRDDLALPISQDGDIFRAKVTRALSENLSFGLDFALVRTTIFNQSIRDLLTPIYPGAGIEVTETLFGPVLTWDDVNDNIYPSQGTRVTLTSQKGQGQDGFDADFWSTTLLAETYSEFGDNGVFASKVATCYVTDGAPFFNLCGLGLTDGFRGYPSGQYLGHTLLSAQTEYRHRFGKRFGATLFAGAGVVADSYDALGDAEVLYAGGIGLRYRLSKKFPMDFSIDAAINHDGEQTTYLYIGQAF